MIVVQVPVRKPLELVERPSRTPAPARSGSRSRPAASATAMRLRRRPLPGIQYPPCPATRSPAAIDAVGPACPSWQVGQRVGVGWHGGHCGYCDTCRRGDFFACQTGQVTGITLRRRLRRLHGRARDAARGPFPRLAAADAAPLMCAGLTTFNALRNSGAPPRRPRRRPRPRRARPSRRAVRREDGLPHRRHRARQDKEPLATCSARHYIDSQAARRGRG